MAASEGSLQACTLASPVPTSKLICRWEFGFHWVTLELKGQQAVVGLFIMRVALMGFPWLFVVSTVLVFHRDTSCGNGLGLNWSQTGSRIHRGFRGLVSFIFQMPGRERQRCLSHGQTQISTINSEEISFLSSSFQ